MIMNGSRGRSGNGRRIGMRDEVERKGYCNCSKDLIYLKEKKKQQEILTNNKRVELVAAKFANFHNK